VGRYQFGPGRDNRWYPGMSMPAQVPDTSTEREVERIVEVVRQHGTIGRAQLERTLGPRNWGPGRLAAALRTALGQGRPRRVGPSSYRLEH
jgi:hypothetical protein